MRYWPTFQLFRLIYVPVLGSSLLHKGKKIDICLADILVLFRFFFLLHRYHMHIISLSRLSRHPRARWRGGELYSYPVNAGKIVLWMAAGLTWTLYVYVIIERASDEFDPGLRHCLSRILRHPRVIGLVVFVLVTTQQWIINKYTQRSYKPLKFLRGHI